ncbi:unnamed protein product [Linum trigynum]|uniref:Uncharacterized protein n=1 Tax=Linum trigynum TaxID=586398 RepID=A0AAV2E489_9ROSI
MLSTVNTVLSAPVPVVHPDRPPDPGPTLTDNSPDPAGFPPATGTDMLIDPSATTSPTITSSAVPAAATPTSTDPQPKFSYASAVAGWRMSEADQVSMKQWTPVGENDLIPGKRNGEPALNISSEFKNRICAPWQRTIVVRLLGTKIGFNALCSRLRSL